MKKIEKKLQHRAVNKINRRIEKSTNLVRYGDTVFNISNTRLSAAFPAWMENASEGRLLAEGNDMNRNKPLHKFFMSKGKDTFIDFEALEKLYPHYMWQEMKWSIDFLEKYKFGIIASFHQTKIGRMLIFANKIIFLIEKGEQP